MRLPSRLRLKASRDFAEMRASGKSEAGRTLVLAVKRVENLAEFRFGIVTSKRLGSAVVRNRLRRRLREIVRAHRAEIRGGFHFVMIPRWRAVAAAYSDMEAEWLRLGRRLGLLLKPVEGSP
jgi:ribonuclease P protein component